MARSPKASRRAEMRRAAEDSIELLRQDPKRMKSLMRSAAAFAEEVSVVLADAGHDPVAGRVRTVSRSLRAAAILPAGACALLARKLLARGFDRKG